MFHLQLTYQLNKSLRLQPQVSMETSPTRHRIFVLKNLAGHAFQCNQNVQLPCMSLRRQKDVLRQLNNFSQILKMRRIL